MVITSPSCLKPFSDFTRHLKPELLATETRVPDLTPANLFHHWSESYLFPALLCTGCHAHAIPKVAWLTSFYPTGLNGHVFSSKTPSLTTLSNWISPLLSAHPLSFRALIQSAILFLS